MTDFPIVVAGDDEHLPARPHRRAITTVADLLAAFLGRKNEHTRDAYSRDVDQFRAWLDVGTLEEAAKTLLGSGNGAANMLAQNWREDMISHDPPLAASTINRRLTALRSLVTMARKAGLIVWPLDVDNVAGKTYKDTAGPAPENVKKLFDTLKERAEKLRASGREVSVVFRDRAVLMLLLTMGLRRKEVCGLDLSDADFKRSRLRIIGKGRHEPEWLRMPAGASRCVREWLAFRGERAGPLIVSYTRGGMSPRRISLRGMNELVEALGNEAGVDVSPHALRHSAITTSLQINNGNMAATQAFARHSDPATTGIYFDNMDDVAGKTADQVDRFYTDLAGLT